MIDNITKSEFWNVSRSLAFLILIALIGPHTLQISSTSYIDYSYLRYTVFSVVWAASYETGSTIAGPYIHSFLEFFSISSLVLSALFLPLYLIVIIMQMRYKKGTTSKQSVLHVVGLTLIIQAFILFTFFWFQLDGWAFTRSYPLPIFHVLVVLSVVQQGRSESNQEADLRDLPQKPWRTSYLSTISFSCVSLLFLTVGAMLISNFFSAILLQPAYALSQFLIGLGFIATGLTVIIVYMRAEYGR